MANYKTENAISKNHVFIFFVKLVKTHPFSVLAFIIFICLNNLCALLVSIFMKLFIDIASGESVVSLFYAFLLALSNLLLLGISGTFVNILKNKLYCLSELGLRQKIVEKVYHISLHSFEKKEPGTYLTNCTLDIEHVSRFTIETLFIQIFAESLTFIISIVLIFFLSWKLGFVLTILFPIFIYLIIKCSPVIDKWNQKIVSYEEKNRNLLQEIFDNYVLFKSYNMQIWINKRVSDRYKEKAVAMARLGLIQGGVSFLNNFLGVGMFILALGMGSFLVLKGETTIGSLIAIVNLVSFYYGPFLHISKWITASSEAKTSACRLNIVLDNKEEFHNITYADEPLLSIGTEKLYYQYPGKRCILENISVEFKKGYSYAIQGESGSGKSTFLKILSGLIAPAEGEVFYSTSTNTVHNASPGTKIGYDSSVFSVFTGTIRENICMDFKEDNEKFKNVVCWANLEKLVGDITADYYIDTSGINLSAGQLRRISLARVFYSQKEILILDEPSSNLDVESVDILINTIKDLKKDKIIIVATHDKRVAESCDYQYCIVNGTLLKG